MNIHFDNKKKIMPKSVSYKFKRESIKRAPIAATSVLYNYPSTVLISRSINVHFLYLDTPVRFIRRLVFFFWFLLRKECFLFLAQISARSRLEASQTTMFHLSVTLNE